MKDKVAPDIVDSPDLFPRRCLSPTLLTDGSSNGLDGCLSPPEAAPTLTARVLESSAPPEAAPTLTGCRCLSPTLASLAAPAVIFAAPAVSCPAPQQPAPGPPVSCCYAPVAGQKSGDSDLARGLAWRAGRRLCCHRVRGSQTSSFHACQEASVSSPDHGKRSVLIPHVPNSAAQLSTVSAVSSIMASI